jgi:hypothetical protein
LAAQTLPTSSAGAAPVEEFHQQLFANSSNELLEEIKRIMDQAMR